MALFRRAAFLLFLSLLYACAAAGAPAESNPTYVALRALRPQGEALAVKGLTIERDAFRFRFEAGTFQFLTLPDGRAVGAVFAGEGGYELRPALESERRHLAFVAAEKDLAVLSDRFDSAVLLFTDGTAAEIRKAGAVSGSAPGSGDVYDSFFRKQKKDLQSNLQLRLARDLLSVPGPATGVFMAYVAGKKYPPAFAFADPAGVDWLAPHLLLSGEETAFYALGERESGFWYLAHRQSESSRAVAHPSGRSARAVAYNIETTVKGNSGIRGTTVIELKPLSPSLRVLGLQLLGKLRIQEAAFSESNTGPWKPAAVIQEAAEEDSDAAVVFPEALAADKPPFLRVVYEGKDVLRDVGDGNFVVSARESWYPNLATFSELASFDLTYRFPKNNEVVSVGRLVATRAEGDNRVSVWKTERPIRVAGFNYGRFKKVERTDNESGLHVEVYTNPGTPDVINEINALLQSQTGQRHEIGTNPAIPSDLDSPFASPSGSAGLRSLHVDTDGLADSAMVDAINTARVCSIYFGRLPENRIAITQQAQWTFGQSWPSLVFLPYLAALDGTTRYELGLKNTSDFVELVGPHEVAHQWWGHLVGWASYRDQWLSEGLAEFSASLVLQRSGGGKKFNDYWEKARRRITGKPPQSALFNDGAGPITQGWRLATRRSPGAYEAMVYAKGAYVMHMLRMMLRAPGSDPDARFIAMMKDFVTSYAGQNPSTRDFQAVIERHMIPSMNAAGDGKMEWFFKQWVFGTEIPRYREKLEIAKKSENEYRISGTITQEGVSPDFHALAHVYAEFPKGEVAHLGAIPMTGSGSTPVDVTMRLPKTPKRLLLNALHDVLSRD